MGRNEEKDGKAGKSFIISGKEVQKKLPYILVMEVEGKEHWSPR